VSHYVRSGGPEAGAWIISTGEPRNFNNRLPDPGRGELLAHSAGRGVDLGLGIR
jgi:hypothetical protein